MIAWLVVLPIVGVIEMIKYMVKGKTVVGKIFVTLFIAGAVCAFIFKPNVFRALMIIIAIVDLLFASIMVKNANSSSRENEYENYNSDNSATYRKTTIPFFEGMSVDEAKKEYRKLMKCYHPDNVGGSLEMTQRISEAYSKYCAVYGR